jgi:protein phosphatase 4 regulatory subunit 3
MLLETRIGKEETYQKQQGPCAAPDMSSSCQKLVADITRRTETLIVWTETNGTDMALSFQEAEGCAVIW